MTNLDLLNAGILLSGAVSAVVGVSAIMLSTFLLQRWRRLNWVMRSYALFWILTVLVWLPISARYFVIAFAPASSFAHLLDIMLQTAVFLGGPPLVAYAMLRITDNRRLSIATAFFAGIWSLIALGYLIQPNGLIPQEPTFFSAETVPNQTSLTIFGVLSTLIFFLLVYDLGHRVRQYFMGMTPQIYEALYTLPIIVYLLFGSMEQIGLVADLTLVIFRILYTAAFLSVYVLMTEHEASTETFFLKRNSEKETTPAA